MAEHRFFAGDGVLAALEPGAEVALTADAAHRIAHVLRLRPGERISLFGEGGEFACELVDAGRLVRARLIEELPAATEQRRLVLYPALIRPNRFEWLIEKTTEVGVAAIVPILSERCAVRAAEIGAARLERWRRIAIEAAEQCGRRTVPTIGAPLAYPDALSRAGGRLVLAWEGLRGEPSPRPRTLPASGGPNPGGGSVAPAAAGSEPIALFIGPEGGWSDAEVAQARAAGAVLLGLGTNVLRAETAAVVASAQLLLDRVA